MSIFIQGFELPKNCGKCIFRYKYMCMLNHEMVFKSTNNRHENCPLVEVPPHGRLIDADALLKSISRAIEDDSDIADVYEEDYELVNDWLASAPTIIEAEEGET